MLMTLLKKQWCKDNIIIGKMQIDVVVFLSGNYILALI